MKKLVYFLFPVVVLALFVSLMQSASFLKRPAGRDDDVAGNLMRLQFEVEKERWPDADRTLSVADGAWKKVVRRIQFTAGRDEINQIGNYLARLKGSIAAKDKKSALSDLALIRHLWDQIGK